MSTETPDCPHVDFNVSAVVNRLVDDDPEQGQIPPATGFMVDITVGCRDCGEPFEWVGSMPAGVCEREPCVSPDRTELRAPIRPRSGAVGRWLGRMFGKDHT